MIQSNGIWDSALGFFEVRDYGTHVASYLNIINRHHRLGHGTTGWVMAPEVGLSMDQSHAGGQASSTGGMLHLECNFCDGSKVYELYHLPVRGNIWWNDVFKGNTFCNFCDVWVQD